jgi:p-hydroxybenzoate 3-monooxygenase
MLAHLLHRHGIDSVVIEKRTRQYVIERVRAGVLEQGTVDLMIDVGLGDRLQREGLRHNGLYMAFAGARHHLDMAGLTGGRAITIYGQNEVVKDLLDARAATGRPLLFDVEDVSVEALTSDAPVVRFRKDGETHELACDYIAGCDGFHGICRPSIPADHLRIYERVYPFGWLGILAEAPPSSGELVYSLHERGFALFSMRSPTITRLYLQCEPDEELAPWTDERIWSELRARLETNDGWKPNEGPILQKGVTGMRSFVAEPMRFGRLFLAGDSAHIVPPTGAKGLNLAMADVYRLAFAVAELYRTRSQRLLDMYSERALKRTWRAQRFSWFMTSMLHVNQGGERDNPFDYRRQLAELEYLFSSRAAMTSLAESYAGAPFEHE